MAEQPKGTNPVGAGIATGLGAKLGADAAPAVAAFAAANPQLVAAAALPVAAYGAYKYVGAVKKQKDEYVKKQDWARKIIGGDKVLTAFLDATAWGTGAIGVPLHAMTNVLAATGESVVIPVAKFARNKVVNFDQTFINASGFNTLGGDVFSDIELWGRGMAAFTNEYGLNSKISLPFSQFRHANPPDPNSVFARYSAEIETAPDPIAATTNLANTWLLNIVRQSLADPKEFEALQKKLEDASSPEHIRYQMMLRRVLDRFLEIFDPGQTHVFVWPRQIYIRRADANRARRYNGLFVNSLTGFAANPAYNINPADRNGRPILRRPIQADIWDTRAGVPMDMDRFRQELGLLGNNPNPRNPIDVFRNDVLPEVFPKIAAAASGDPILLDELTQFIYKLFLQVVDPQKQLEAKYLGANGAAIPNRRPELVRQQAATAEVKKSAVDFPGSMYLSAGSKGFLGGVLKFLKDGKIKDVKTFTSNPDNFFGILGITSGVSRGGNADELVSDFQKALKKIDTFVLDVDQILVNTPEASAADKEKKRLLEYLKPAVMGILDQLPKMYSGSRAYMYRPNFKDKFDNIAANLAIRVDGWFRFSNAVPASREWLRPVGLQADPRQVELIAKWVNENIPANEREFATLRQTVLAVMGVDEATINRIANADTNRVNEQILNLVQPAVGREQLSLRLAIGNPRLNADYRAVTSPYSQAYMIAIRSLQVQANLQLVQTELTNRRNALDRIMRFIGLDVRNANRINLLQQVNQAPFNINAIAQGSLLEARRNSVIANLNTLEQSYATIEAQLNQIISDFNTQASQVNVGVNPIPQLNVINPAP